MWDRHPLYGQNAEFLSAKPGGTYNSNHWARKVLRPVRYVDSHNMYVSDT